jgi:hypothetical protein
MAGRINLTFAVCHGQFREMKRRQRSFIQGWIMPEYQPVSSAHVAAIGRPRCPSCNQNRMLLSKLESGPSGFDCHTFECQKCGRVQTTIVSSDPMTSGASGWLAGELKPPT